MKIEQILSCIIDNLTDVELQELLAMVPVVERKCKEISKEASKRRYQGSSNNKGEL